MFNAVSMGLFGESNLVLRLLTSIELFIHSESYLKQFINLASNQKWSNYPTTTLQLLFHFQSSEATTRSMFSVFQNEAILIATPGKFASLSAVFGLSNVVCTEIQSVYSPRSCRWFPMFTQKIKPRYNDAGRSTICLLWSSTSKNYEKPNHFVLCSKLNHITPISSFSNSVTLPKKTKHKESLINFTTVNKKVFKESIGTSAGYLSSHVL